MSLNRSNALNLELSIEERLESICQIVNENDLDDIIECICSAYTIHPTFITLQYIYQLVLHPKFSIIRRIRIAESCELYSLSMYLLHSLKDIQEKIACIEMFNNVYLKLHAYRYLYSKIPPLEFTYLIQIYKNCWRWVDKKYKYFYIDCLYNIMNNSFVEYKYRSNCADFILNHNPTKEMKKQCEQFLNIDSNISFYEHKENVHLILPNEEEVCSLIKTNPSTTKQYILQWIELRNLHIDSRIFNDKTELISGITLETLLCCVWNILSDDLKLCLIEDINTTSWECTTGYYHRILSFVQPFVEMKLFIPNTFRIFHEEFTNVLERELNKYNNVDTILSELSEQSISEAKRIHYLTFRVQRFDDIVVHLKQKFSHLNQMEFDEFFSKSVRLYENVL